MMGSAGIDQDLCNQSASHIQQQSHQQQPPSHQHQKSQLLPLLLSPRPPSNLKVGSAEEAEQRGSDHDQIIEQVISLENEFNDASGTMASVDDNLGLMMSQQSQPHQMEDVNLVGSTCIADNNQLSDSSEDLLNILLQFDKEPSNLVGLGNNQQLDPDERVGIETIRKQLMSCEVQSDQAQHQSSSMSPILNQLTCSSTTQHDQRATIQYHQRHSVHSQPQLVSQTAPVILHHQQPQHQLSTPGPSQAAQQAQHRLSVDQSLLHSSYSNEPVSSVPVSSSGQSYAPQQHQNVARLAQSNPMSIVSNSPSPSWQQPQLSPYSPQNQQHSSSRTTPSQRQGQQQQQPHSIQQHQTTTSPQLQHLHHPVQRRSPSQSVSPPATNEPSPVVKKNPLLNAQLVNSRPPSITPTRFMNTQANVLNQNPILNSKLSQSPFVTNTAATVGNPMNPSLSTQPRFIQQPQQQSSFNFDITQQPHQQQNAQQHTPPQTGHMSLYRTSDQTQQQQSSFRTTTTTAAAAATGTASGVGGGGSSQVAMGSSTSPVGGFSQQVKQEIRKKVQQPKQQQTTSLLKQLLSDDNK